MGNVATEKWRRRQGAQKPSGGQTAKVLWAMKAALDKSEDCYDPDREDAVLGRARVRLDLWEEHLKDPILELGKSVGMFGKSTQGWHWVSQCVVASFCRRNGLQHRWRTDFAKKSGSLALRGPMVRGVFRVSSRYLRVPGKYGPHSELFFVFTRKEPVALTEVPFEPCVSAETLKACGLLFLVQKMKLDHVTVNSHDLGVEIPLLQKH